MKLSISNFKTIGSLANYEMQPLTILSGTNSSGKSSFIQLFLLLKQTLEIDSAQRPLDLSGKLFKVRNYLDIIKGKSKDNRLKVEFVFEKYELDKYKDFSGFNVYDAFDNYHLYISINFNVVETDNKIIVSSFEVKFVPEGEGQQNVTTFENNNDSIFDVKTNLAVLVSNDLLARNKEYTIKKINYSSFIPSEIEIEFSNPSIELPDGSMSLPSTSISKEVPKLDGIKAVLKDFFANLNYVGPSRLAPKDEYSAYGKINSVGTEGENVAEAFYQLSENTISFFKIEEKDEVVSFVKTEDSFLNAVKYWLCERFKMCADVYSKKEADNYVIYVKSLTGVESTIKHVGFGISQVLPIIVEGLRIGFNETLVIEQPEIHLHPKVQSNLTDFLISLIKQDKKVILETHSDHLITRLRRRIAEDQDNQLDNKVLLTFVEVGKDDVLFKNISINDFGIMELPYPDDFIERTDIELKAILKAQMKKRLNRK